MLYLVICIVAFSASLLTFFSGFGLGTLLLPAFLFFFPPAEAILMTALVHVVNSLFKAGLLFRHFNKTILLSFGVSALLGAVLGANSLLYFKTEQAFYTVFERPISTLSFIIGLLMIVFALFELVPKIAEFRLKKNAFFIGGFLSGYFGGLSGHQGAFRSMFLIKGGLSTAQFVATGTAIALIVDLVRIPIYFTHSSQTWQQDNITPILVGCLSAISGAFLGKKWLTKVKMKWVHILVGMFIFCMGIALLVGLL
jgi:uncharacterized protein